MPNDVDLFDPDEAVKFCAELVSDAEEIPEKGEDFAASVIDKANSMSEWIDANSTVTEKIEAALRNMRRGVDSWLENRR
jgi:hypothetical protein